MVYSSVCATPTCVLRVNGYLRSDGVMHSALFNGSLASHKPWALPFGCADCRPLWRMYLLLHNTAAATIRLISPNALLPGRAEPRTPAVAGGVLRLRSVGALRVLLFAPDAWRTS